MPRNMIINGNILLSKKKNCISRIQGQHISLDGLSVYSCVFLYDVILRFEIDTEIHVIS